MSLLDIFLILLIISAISLFIYLIIWLGKVGKTIDSISLDIKDLHNRAIPLIDNLTKTSESASNLTTKAEEYVNDFTGLIDTLSGKLSWLKNKNENSVKEKNYPGEGLFINLRAVSKGVIAFIKNL